MYKVEKNDEQKNGIAFEKMTVEQERQKEKSQTTKMSDIQCDPRNFIQNHFSM